MTAASDTPREQDEEGTRNHLDELADGCGCAELWEYLSERRNDGD